MPTRFALALLLAGTLIAQKPDLTGTWEGALQAGGATLRLVVHITRTPDGTFAGKLDSIDQGAMGLPLEDVKLENGKVTFLLKVVNGTYEGSFNEAHTEIAGTWSQGAPLPLTLKRTDKPSELKRPQNPVRPYPYDERELTFQNKSADVTLAATLTLPKGKGPFPAAILITGSGPQDRDESLLGHKPFLILSDHLTRNGIAVLRYDDRGTAKSTGNFSTATTADFAVDAAAAVDILKTIAEIDPKRIGLIGHSEGGIVAPMVATTRGDIAFIVLIAGTAVTGEKVLVEQGRAILKASGASQQAMDLQSEMQGKMFAINRAEKDSTAAAAKLREALKGKLSDAALEAQVKAFTSPWMRYFLTYDPALALSKLKTPVLALNGELDTQVLPDQNLPPMEAALKEAGNNDYTIRRLPGLNHMLQTAKTGAPGEYSQIEETMSPVALNTISDWIHSEMKLEKK